MKKSIIHREDTDKMIRYIAESRQCMARRLAHIYKGDPHADILVLIDINQYMTTESKWNSFL
jgi:hypothetical protein